MERYWPTLGGNTCLGVGRISKKDEIQYDLLGVTYNPSFAPAYESVLYWGQKTAALDGSTETKRVGVLDMFYYVQKKY